MKLLVLSLLVLTSLCFVLGAEEDFANLDLDANEGELFDAPEDFVEDEQDNYMEDDEDFEEEEDDGEPKDPRDFKDDDSNDTEKPLGTKRPVLPSGKPVIPVTETFPPVEPGEGPGSGMEDPDLNESLEKKLGLNPAENTKK